MATFFTDALYSATNLGVSNTSYFALSSTSNEVVLFSAGALNGSPVVGVAYEQANWQLGNTVPTVSALAVSKRLTLKPYINGVPSGDAPTTLVVNVSGAAGAALPFAVLLKDKSAVVINYVGTTTTYSLDLSADTYDVSDKNTRRAYNLMG
jgi:hypothetical protein